MEKSGTLKTGAERALGRMRTYTTGSLVLVVAFFAVLAAVGASTVPYGITLAIVGAGVAYYATWWETPPPLWLTALLVVASGGVWTVAVVRQESPIVALLVLIVAMVPISQWRRHRWTGSVAAVLLTLVPVGIAWLVAPDPFWPGWVVAVVASAAAAVFLFFLNQYAWGLYLEIDKARQLAADLAVAQERYRFATDLHDIQGHTLHVLRLKTQLAARLIDRDPDAAREHLVEADALIAETLANTRSLAFGDRRVSLAAELANARGLFDAAGITCRIDGEPAPGAHEELLGLVVREATTNILRHAQSTTVGFALSPGRLVVTNDGSPASTRALSGLARLAERFAAVGGTLRTTNAGGTFTTEVVTG